MLEFFNEVKKRLQDRYFLVNISKTFKNSFFIEHWLLLCFKTYFQRTCPYNPILSAQRLLSFNKTISSHHIHISVTSPFCEVAGSPSLQKQPSRGVLRKNCSENMQQISRRTPMPKCVFETTLRHGCSSVNLLHIFSKLTAVSEPLVHPPLHTYLDEWNFS